MPEADDDDLPLEGFSPGFIERMTDVSGIRFLTREELRADAERHWKAWRAGRTRIKPFTPGFPDLELNYDPEKGAPPFGTLPGDAEAPAPPLPDDAPDEEAAGPPPRPPQE